VALVERTVRVAEDVATASTATAGAVAGAAAGAAAGAVVGAVRGAVRGAGSGLTTGARSEAAAAVGLAAVGAAGVVEWPIVLTVGGGALILRQLRRTQVPLRRRPAAVPADESRPVSTAGPSRRRGAAPPAAAG
jgi:hypothetical protein